ncbi:MAG TPA: hypothetical protein VLL74_01275, partial [Methanoregula sp.]|nr:hypothetical protein [Methanoregula sp.]
MKKLPGSYKSITIPAAKIVMPHAQKATRVLRYTGLEKEGKIMKKSRENPPTASSSSSAHPWTS